MEFKFSEESLQKIEQIIKKYPVKRAAVMPVLYVAQAQNGWISKEVMLETASVLDMNAEDVFGVATFYTMYHKKEPGKFHIQVCTNVSCMLRGGYQIYDAVKAKLGLNNGEVSDDMKFSLEEVECMGSCGTAPMIAVNEDYFENLDKEKALQILDSLN